MKQRVVEKISFFKIKNKKLRIVNYVTSGLLLIYIGLISYPNFLFAHSVKYKNFKVYSTEKPGDNIFYILEDASKRLSTSEINNKDLTHSVYLCNNYMIYTFFAPLSRKAFACNYPIINNIFIADCDISKNEAYKNDETDQYTRQLSTLITHESTHTLILKKTGFARYKNLNNWKNEGYCDYVAYGPGNLQENKRFLALHKSDKKPGTDYRKYYIAVDYLLRVKKMTFDNLISSSISFEDVLKEIESI